MTNSGKKRWNAPSLRVLVRTRTEESVLASCKLSGQSGIYPLAVGCRGRYSCSPVCYDRLES